MRIVISIHAPREGGDFFDFHAAKSQDISIHAPREGGDFSDIISICTNPIISIHAPREGGDSSAEY